MFAIQRRISRRFFAAFMFIAIIPAGLMGFQAYRLAKKALTTWAFRHVETIAQDHARHLDAWLTERLNDIGSLAKLSMTREAILQLNGSLDPRMPCGSSLELLKETFAQTRERSPSYESIYAMLLDGRTIASTLRPSEDFSDGERNAFMQQLLDGGEPAIGSLCRGADSRWHMLMGARILNYDGSPLGVIVSVVDVSQMIDPVMSDRIGLGETGETYLVGKEGKIISESRFLDRVETTKRSFDTVGIRSVLDRKQGASIYTSYTGSEVLGAYTWLPRYDWGLLAEMDTEEILSPLKWIKVMSLLTALVAAALCSLLSYAVSKRIAEPITEVANAAQRMAEGDLDQQIAFTSQDEVGRLAGSFNAMAQRVSRLVQSLHHKEESLQKAYDELVAAQEQLVHSERMAAIGELVACVAHEMRNPLSSIKLNLQVIELDLQNDEVLSEHCAIALDQVSQLDRMFSDLLNYSRPLVLEKSQVAVRELLDRSLEQLGGEILAREIRVVRNDSATGGSVMVDEDKIVQVLVNVLKNAMEASPPRGEIEVRIREEDGRELQRAVISITDRGQGIPARNLQTVYQPFFTTRKKGTGLGLSIVKKIMDAHGGAVFISSEEGKGATVHLFLPLA